MREVPVYLFTGFLESGKTSFIQETLQDERFNTGENTLLLVCEEGEEEYDKSKFKVKNVFIETVEDMEDLTPTNLSNLLNKHLAQRVLIEYNGMWTLDNLYQNVPEGWMIYQEIMSANSKTFEAYNTNMRQLTVDKLQSCELIVFNRFDETFDKVTFHKIVRGVSRRTDIAYEYHDEHVEYDDIEDPLPFDIDAKVIEIKDEDYAIWFRDFSEEMKKYIGKTVKFKGLVAADKRIEKGSFIVGRPIMVCCEEDTSYRGLICKSDFTPENRQWVTVEAKIVMQKHKLYGGDGPVLIANKVEPAQAPENEVATFY